MLETDPSFRPVRVREGYPPLEDLGLIGDGATVALVGLDGSIYWLCLPRFDSEPVFCGLLDRDRGGHFTITPDELTEARQRYEPDTGVLVTELRSPTGLVRLTDALALRSGADLTDDVPGGRGELIRSAVVLDGNVRLRVELEPRGGAQTWMAASGLRLNPSRRPDLRLHLRSSRPLSGLHGTYDLQQGDSLNLVLSWGRFHRHHRFDAETMLQGTAAAWRRWMTHFSYEQPMRVFVKRPVSGVGRGWLARWRQAAGLEFLRGWAVAGWGAVALVLRLYLASKRACGPDSLHSSLGRGRGCSRS